MIATRRSPGRGILLPLVLELVVVFVSVYAAFAFSEYQAQREASERRRQILLALVREIEDITSNTRNAEVQVGRMVAHFDSALAVGGTPSLIPMMEAIRVENHMWEAALGSGGLDLLDVATIYQLSDFYNELNGGFARMEQLRELSQALLVPNAGAGTSEFYERPGRLRGKYGWYLPALRNLQGVAGRITTKGDTLVARLGARQGETPSASRPR